MCVNQLHVASTAIPMLKIEQNLEDWGLQLEQKLVLELELELKTELSEAVEWDIKSPVRLRNLSQWRIEYRDRRGRLVWTLDFVDCYAMDLVAVFATY